MPLSRLMGARTRTRFASLVLSVSLVLGLFGGLFGLVEATPAGAAGAPTQLAYTTNPSTVAAGAAMTAPVVQLRDSGNNNVLQSGTTVSVAINTGPGSFDPSATTTTTTNSSGQAIFSNLVFDTTGSYTLVATSTGLTSKVSGSFNVTPGPTTQLALSNVPSTVVSGAALGITVTAQDAEGNTETTLSTGSVSLAVNTGPVGGALAGTTTRNFSGGVVTFSAASLTTVGSYTLNASSTGFPTVTTGSISVTAGVAKKLGFVQGPTATTAGSVMSPSPTVQVEDLNGNPVVDTGVSVTLSSSGTLTSGSTKVVSTDVNGTATFSNLTWNTAGTYTIAASATGLTATGNSSTFTISPTNPVNLVFTTQPTTTSAGSVVSTTVVKIEDSLGNVITSSSDPVTLTPVGPGAFDPSSTPTVNAVNGVATFSNLILDTSGSYTLSASSTDGATGTSHAFTVSPLAATHLAFSQAPANVTAGTVQVPNVQVQAQDQYGNVATTATGTVTLTASPSVTLTSGTRALSSGVATFGSLNIQTAGTYTLTASLTGLTSATSGSFTVSPNVPFQLVFTTQPTNIVAGQLITPSPAVSIEDRFGNLETSDNTDTVTLAGSVAAGSTATETAAAGVATFDNVTIDVVGNVTHTLSATSVTTPSLKSATSASFTVSPGAPASLAIIQPQLGGQVNTGNSIGTFYLEQYDQYGNNTWGSVGTPLNFSSSSSGGTFSLTQGGPSTTTATFPYPPNNSNPPNNRDLFFYYGDTNVGLPTITVSSPGLVSATQSVEIINVESPGDQTSSTGSTITPLTITGQNSSPDYTFTSWSATGLPDGLSIDNTGTITGTPTTPGTYSVEVFGYEGTYAYGYATFTWTIGNTVTVTSPGDQTNVSGTAITPLAISASDSSPSATLTYGDGGTLPPGLSIDPSSGTITGTPTTSGTYPVTITATDDSDNSGNATFNWTVTNTVSVTSPGNQTGTSGTVITDLPITASDSSPAAILSYSDGGTLPPGLSIKSSTGVITGTPTAGGTYSVTITATDDSGFSGSASFTWTITNTVSVASIPNQNGTTGVTITPLTAIATDSQHSPAPVITWSASGLPAGLSIGASTGTISGAPTTPGTSSVTVTASDNAHPTNTGSTSFTWTIGDNRPVITSLSRTSGPGSGGAKIKILGSRFLGVTSVKFGSVAVSHFTVTNKGTKIRLTVPPGMAGTVDVVVTASGGSNSPGPSDRYTYGGPAISTVSPSSGPASGGGKVTITGTGLSGATSVMFGSDAGTNVTANKGGTSVTAIAPAHAAGTVDVAVTTPGGTATDSDAYTYSGPVVTAVNPTSGPATGGKRVTITGTDLGGATSVTFGSVAGTNVTPNGPGTKITVGTPAESAGIVSITITTASGTVVVPAAYTFS